MAKKISKKISKKVSKTKAKTTKAPSKSAVQSSGRKNSVQDHVFTVSKDVFYRLQDEKSIVVMDVRTPDRYQVIDGYASTIFTMIDGKKSVGEILEKVSSGRELPARFTKDAVAFFDKLKKEKLIS